MFDHPFRRSLLCGLLVLGLGASAVGLANDASGPSATAPEYSSFELASVQGRNSTDVTMPPEITIDPEEIVVNRKGQSFRSPNVTESASRSVSFADLDLRQYVDVVELHRRVATMAQAICDKLHEHHELGVSVKLQSQECVRKAIHEAADQVHDAVARVHNYPPAWMH